MEVGRKGFLEEHEKGFEHLVCLNIEFYPVKTNKDFFQFLLILAIFKPDVVLTKKRG
jgi:hypothetical protein